MATERRIHSRINPNPETLATEGNVPLPVMWGDDHASVVGGVVLTDTGHSADADGRMLLRPGTVLVPDTEDGEYRAATSVVDIAGDPDATPAVPAAESVLILKTTADLSGGNGLVGAFYRGGFLGTRMPSLADNATPGLEAAAKTALKAHGFVFGEDFGAHN